MRYFKLYFLIVITTLSTLNSLCLAQNISAVASIDRDSIYAGQPVDYTLKINIPNGYVIDWSNINDTISKNIEILNKGEITETPANNGKDIVISRLLKLTTFDTGYIEIPQVNLKYYRSADDTVSHDLSTDIIDIYVQGADIDTTATYRDIKVPIKQNITFEESVPYVGSICVLAGLIALILFLVKRFKKREVSNNEEDSKPKVPAIITAREKMTLLKEANLWQSGKLKEFYTDLTDIVREYLEGQFNIEAIEMTSDEILTEVRKIELDNSTFSKLQDTLLTADLVKFAKANTSPSQNDEAFSNINIFIENSFAFHQESEKKKAEEAKAKKYDFEDTSTEKQEMEGTK